MKRLLCILTLPALIATSTQAKQFEGDELEKAIEYAKDREVPLAILYGG
ncbi:hypothetical protein OAB00_01950 [Akkermansiaceae bacterium]|nr:hypothetical protein [Akkermansiaceae bacterium]